MKVFRQDAFHSPDTDVSVLSDRRYPHLCKKTPHLSQAQARIIETMFHALDPAKAAVLPAFRVSSGAGNTGCFSGKGKASGWKTFIQVDEKEVLSGFLALGVSAIPSRETLALIKKFVCQLGI